MTPQERQMVDELFDRLERLETAPRDADAENALADGLKRAPHALYALVQSVLVQDEALKRADARIRELTGEDAEVPQTRSGFLDSMRNALAGRTSVPRVPSTARNSGDTYAAGNIAPAAASHSGGGSFLGTAAASAAGMIGGAMLFNSIRSMFGHNDSSAFAAIPSSASRDDSSSELARDAGIRDVGSTAESDDKNSAGLFDNNSADDFDDSTDDLGGDFGDFGDDSA
jgi:uncharacterized protein